MIRAVKFSRLRAGGTALQAALEPPLNRRELIDVRRRAQAGTAHGKNGARQERRTARTAQGRRAPDA